MIQNLSHGVPMEAIAWPPNAERQLRRWRASEPARLAAQYSGVNRAQPTGRASGVNCTQCSAAAIYNIAVNIYR